LFEFDGRTLCEAVRNTFKRRSTSIPEGLPFAFTDDFKKDVWKQNQWRAFLRKFKPKTMPGALDVVIGEVATFLIPIVEAVRSNSSLELAWMQGGPWRSK